MLFRKALLTLRRLYRTNTKNYFAYSISFTVLMAAITTAVDALVPFEGAWNILRSVLLVPTAVALFATAYGIGLYLHFRKTATDDEWVPFRARFSPAWRTRIALIVGAVLLVLIYALGQQPGYTLVSSVFGAIIIALFAFLRRTRDEAAREEYNIPDIRDTRFNEARRLLDATRKEKSKRGKKANSEAADAADE